MSREALYTELYKKYATDLTDDQIAEKVKYASSVPDQQAVIDTIYEKYTGKKPTFDQRLYITKQVDQQNINSVIKNENARRQAAYEKLVEDQKAKKLKDEEECNPGSECAKLKAAEDENKRIQDINDEFDSNFIGGKNSKDPDYLRLKDADAKDKALYLKEKKLQEEYDLNDKGEKSWWGNIKQTLAVATTDPGSFLIFGFNNPKVYAANAQQEYAYDKEMELEALEQDIAAGNVTPENKQKLLDLTADLQGAYRTVNKVDIVGAPEYFDNKYQEIIGRQITELNNRYPTEEDKNTEEYAREYADIKSQRPEDIELTKEDFDSETDYNLYNQRQQDNNLVDQLRNKLSKRYDIAQQRGEMLDDASLYSKTEYEALTEAQNSIFDYNDPMNEEFRLEMDSIAQRLGMENGEELANGLRKSTDKNKYINRLQTKLDNKLNKDYTAQIDEQYDVAENWFGGGYEITIGANDESTTFQGKQLIPKPTKALIERSQKALGNEEDFIQSAGKTTTVDGVEVDAQKNIQNQAFQNLITSDATIKAMMNKYAEEAKPKLEAYKKQLDTKFDFTNKEDVEEANRLLEQKQKELTLDRLYNDPMFKQISTDYGMALDTASRNLDTSFARKDSWFLNTIDKVDAATQYVPIVGLLDEVVEGFVSGAEGMRSSIADKAWGSISGNRYRANKERGELLNKQIEDGDFTAEDRVYFKGGKFYKWTPESGVPKNRSYNAQERADKLRKDKDYWQSEIVEQIEDIADSEEFLSAFRQSDFKDGISFADAALTVGQSLPHIATAGAGAITGNPVLAYLGTAAMFAQMYGDNYWSAIEKNLDKKGLSKEQLKVQFPDKSKAEIDELYKQAAIGNLQTGEGANMAHSAAMAAVQTALETYGANQVIGGTQKALAGKLAGGQLTMGNLFKSSWDDIGNWMLRGAVEKGGNALEEFGTEFMQEIVGQISTAQQAGLESTALIDMDSAFQAGVGGALTGFFLPFSGSVINQTSTMLRQSANDIALKYAPESAMAKSYSVSNEWFKQTTEKLENEYKDKMDDPAKAQEYYEKLAAISNSYNASIKLGLIPNIKIGGLNTVDNFTKNMTEGNRRQLLDDYVKIEEISNQISALDKDDPQVKVLKEELGQVQDRAAELIKAEKTTDKVAQVLKDAGKTEDMIVVDDIQQEANKRNVALDEDAVTTGFFISDKDGGRFVVSKDMAAKMKEGNTAAHELLHKVLFKTLYEVDGDGNIKGKNVARGMAAALDSVLDTLDPADVKDSKFKRKLELYKKDPAAIRAEEKIVLFSDAIESGDLKFNENVFTKIGDQIRRFLQAAGLRDVKFNSGRDVYNFLKDYNASIQKGKLNQAQKKMMNEGAEVGADIRRFQGSEGNLGKVSQKSNKALNDLTNNYQQELKQNPEANPSKELKGQYTAASLDALNRWAAQRGVPLNFYTKQGGLTQQGREALSAVNNQFSDIMRTYKPVVNGKKVSLTTYLDKTIGPRVGTELVSEATRKGKQVSQDVLNEKGVSLETTTQKDFDAKEQQDTSRKKKYPSSLKAVRENITPESKKALIGTVDEAGRTTGAAKTIIQGVGKNISSEGVAKDIIASTKDKSVMQQMRKDIGKFGSDSYNQFVDNVVNEGLTKTIPAATIKRRLGRKANVESGLIDYEQTGTTPTINVTKEGKKTYFDKPVYKINKVDNTKLKEYYKAGEKRQQSLFSMLAEGTIVEGISDLKNDQAFVNKLGDTLELKNKEFKNELDQLKQELTQQDLNAEEVAKKIKTSKDNLTKDYLDNIAEQLDQRSKEDTSLDVVKANKALVSKKNVAKLNEADLAKIMQTSGIDVIAKDLPGETTVTPENRKARQKSVLKSIKDGKVPFEMLKLLGLKNFGAQRIVNNNGDYEYVLDNGKTMLGNPRLDNGKIRRDKNGKKLYDPPTVEQIQEVHGEGVYLQANRGSLFAGKNDPAYLALEETAKENSKSFDQKVLDNFNKVKRIKIKKGQRLTAEIKKKNAAQEKINMQALNDFYNILNTRDKNGKLVIPINDSALLISQAYQGTTSLIKIAAPFVGVSDTFVRATDGKQARLKENFIEEHSPPASSIGAAMIWGLKNNQVDAVMKGIRDNFIQVQLSTADDRKLDLSKLDKTLPEGMSILTPNVGMLRLAAAEVNGANTINLNTITDLKTGKTFAETVGLVIPKSEFNNPSAINYQNRLMVDMALNPELTLSDSKKRLNISMPIQSLKNNNVKKANKALNSEIFNENRTGEQNKNTMVNSFETRVKANKALNKETKGISVFDFDDTLARTKEKVIVTNPDGTVTEISASQFAQQADTLTEAGATFDFSNFEQVSTDTAEGPLAELARKRQGKFGSKDIFVLTARPQTSATAIKTFLDGIGINIPIENITGLEDGSPQAKADWVLNKTAEGYNDFYFADDSFANVAGVKAVLDAVDVKSKVQVAKSNKAAKLDNDFNKQLEEVTGKESFKEYSTARARLEGKQKDSGLIKRFLKQFTITPSADDFMGLMYAMIGKGEQGNRHMKFIKDNLVDIYNKAEQELMSAKIAVANDFAALKKQFPNLKSKGLKNPLLQPIGVGPYTKSQAMRVYMWNKQGMDIPGMSKRDINALVAAVEADNELNVFADEVILIQKDSQYPPPSRNWLAGDIKTDILEGLNNTFRTKLMAEFNENADIIFSEKNLNKIEALYGTKYREALEDSLRRMKSGTNRPNYQGPGSRVVNEMLDWLNSSVGAVMFFNMRSGLLQTLSSVNFINWGDNNFINAAKAFASKEYFPTVLKLMNSDYLVNRRDGLKINVNEAELADAGRKGGIKGMINYILDKGFAITRIMDSVAIATGGATFFINRKKALLNRVNEETGKLYTEAEAEAKAFDDFYAIAEETQQSSNPSKISSQQASMAGRVLLSFQNVTMQYNRKVKKSIQDLYNRRKKPGMTQRESDLSNMSSIIYYVGVQNLVFNALQQALFAMAFEEEDEKEKNRAANVANGMVDSLLFGLGFGGAIVSTVKNIAMRVADESQKKTTDYEDIIWDVFNVSPVLDSKIRKLRTTAKTFDWNMKEIKRRGWSLDNPAYLAVSQIISATTNIPVDRVLRKMMNVGQAFDEETRTWQRIALLLGWSGWNVGLPYWGRQSTIEREAAEDEKLKEKFSNDVRKVKEQGFTKRVPLTGPKAGKPSGVLGVDYVQIERPDGQIQYYKKP